MMSLLKKAHLGEVSVTVWPKVLKEMCRRRFPAEGVVQMAHRTLFQVVPAFLLVVTLAPLEVHAHCDTMDGPVIKDARAAFEARDVGPVLKWIKPESEKEIRVAFQHALAVRTLGAEARELADRFFFETLVRIHREGEGASFSGLRPAGTDFGRAVAAADKALADGSADTLVQLVALEAERGIRERLAHAAEARKHKEESVELGRDYVAAYVEFVHYAERLHDDAVSDASHAEHEAARTAEPHHH